METPANRKRRYFLREHYLCIMFIAFCLLANSREACASNTSRLISVDSLRQSINRSAYYLTGLNQGSGQFVYRTNMDPTVKVKPRYNMLRHAGAIYALAMYHQVQPDQKIQYAIKRAGHFFRSAVGDVPNQPNLLAVWSKPEVTYSKKPLQAKLGGTGLGLVALVSVEQITPGFILKDHLRKLGRFIVFMQKADGSFYSKYIPSEGGRRDQWESLYYPGEAALGLIMLYELDPDETWIQTAHRALTYLADKRKKSSEVPADHWALIATEKLFQIKNKIPQPIDQMLLRRHAWQITEAILNEQIVDRTRGDLYGGFVTDGRTTPTATRLEGLLASRYIFKDETDKTERIDGAIYMGMEFLVRAQVSRGAFAGAFPRAIAKLPMVYHNAEKFNRRAGEIRIDYVQHALCALIQYAAVYFGN